VPEKPCVKRPVYVNSKSNSAWRKGFEKTRHPQGYDFSVLAIERKTAAIRPSNSSIPIHDFGFEGSHSSTQRRRISAFETEFNVRLK
jgi:hypothetical protein